MMKELKLLAALSVWVVLILELGGSIRRLWATTLNPEPETRNPKP